MLTEVTFDVSAENHADVLPRIVLLFHRLAIPICGLNMKRPKNGRRMSVTIELEADTDHAERIRAHLLKIVQIVSVKERPSANSSRRRRPRRPALR
jgi:acetolactate synthase small subunit